MLSTAFRVILSMLTALYTFVVLGSCAATPLPQPVEAIREDIPQESAVPTLNILNSRPEISQALQEAADLFLDGREGEAVIRVQTVSGDSSYRATLRAKLLAGEQADLFHTFGWQDRTELSPYLEELSGLPWAKEAIPFTLEAVTDGDSLYGIPYSVDAVGLIANRDIFDAAELPLGDMAEFDGLEESFRALREQITLGELREEFPDLEAVTELPGQDYSFVGAQLADIALGGEFETAPQAARATAILVENEAAVGRYVDLLARYASAGRGWQRLAQIPQVTQVEEGLATERVAVIAQSVSVYGRIEAVSPEVARRLRLLPIPLPQKEGEEEASGGQLGYIYAEAPAYWAVNAGASRQSKALALEFLTWLYQSETGATLYASRFGAVSPYRETAVDTGVTLHRQMLSYIEQGSFLPRRYREFPADWANRGFGEAVRSYFTLPDYTWQEVINQSRLEWTRLRATE